MRLTAVYAFVGFVSAVLSFKPSESSSLAKVEIRETISRYAIAIDSKNFGLLSDVFTQDAVVKYGLPPPNDTVKGLPAIQDLLRFELNNKVTQHTLSTTLIDFVDERSPNSTAYLVANYLGQGNLTGQFLGVYGRYLDNWVYQKGSWLIKERQLVLFVGATMTP